MNKIWKGKSKKSVTQNVNVEAQCTMPIETGKSKRTRIILPLIVLLALICVIVCVWVQFGRPSEITEIGGDKNAQTEQILAATDVAATTIGTKVKATFTASTGEVVIYGTDASTQGTIKNSGESSLNTFWGKCGVENIKIITFRDRVYAPADSSYLFVHGTAGSTTMKELTNLVTINNAGNLDTSKVTNMRYMLYNCEKLTTVDVSNWNTRNVITMECIFYGCSSLKTIDVSNWNTSNVTTMSSMFYGCSSLTTLDVSGLDFDSLTSLSFMFSGCSGMTTLTGLANKNLSGVSLYDTFNGCSSLLEIDLQNTYLTVGGDQVSAHRINGGSTENATGEFNDCSSLRKLNLTNCNLENLINLVNCKSLNELIVSSSEAEFILPGYYEADYVTQPWGESQLKGLWFGYCVKYYNYSDQNDTTIYWREWRFYGTKEAYIVFDKDVHLKRLENYTITYTLNGGTVTGNPTTYNGLTTNVTLKNPTKTGYTFTGWTGSNGTTPQTVVTTNFRQSTGNLSYIANYDIGKYNITINPNGGIWNNVTANSILNNVTYATTRTIANPTRTGYTFAGWTLSGAGSSINGTTFTMGHANATLTAKWTPRTDTAYTVNHYQQNLNGNAGLHDTTNYTKVLTENLKGTTDSKVTPNRKLYAGFISPNGIQITIKPDGTSVVDYYYPRQSYTVTTIRGRGIEEVTGEGSYIYGESVTINATAGRGYDWSKWTGPQDITTQTYTFTMPAQNVTYTANTTPRTDTEYTVKHWKQNVDGKAEAHDQYNYTEVEEDRQTLIGTTDAEGSGNVNTYTGFTSPNSETVTILGDGTAVLNYYYTRNSYELKLNTSRGVAAALGGGSHLYEEEVTINVMMYVGYEWEKWTGEGLVGEDGTELTEIQDIKYTFKMPANNVEYTTNAIPNPNTKYTIEHYKQKIEGKEDQYNETNYEKADTDVLFGETDSMVSPQVKEYEGFTAPEAKGISVPITGEGTLLIKYYYTRNSYEVKLNKGTGIEDITVTGNITGQGKDKYLYEEQVTIEAEVKPGYTWKEWTVGAPNEENENTVSTQTHTFTIGAEGVEYTAEATPNQDTPYTVKHWQENLPEETTNNEQDTNPDTVGAISNRPTEENSDNNPDVIQTDYNGKKYTLVETENLTGITDEKITPQTKEYAGFTAPEAQEVTILGNGNLEVNYYYTRNLDTPYIVKHWQENLPEETTNNEQDTNPDTVGGISNRPTEENSYNNPDVIQTDYNGKKYTLVDTENKTGITGGTVKPEVKQYAGFTSPEKQTVEILGNGSLEVNYYYTRNTDTPYTVKHWQENLPEETTNNEQDTNPDVIQTDYNGKKYTLVDTENKTGITGGTVKPEVKQYAGFTAPEAQEVEILGDGSLEVNYYYTRNTDTPYTVKHWKENLPEKTTNNEQDTNQDTVGAISNRPTEENSDNNPDVIQTNYNGKKYTLIETDELKGTTGATVTPDTKQYDGLISPEKENLIISPEGNGILNYYYARRKDLTYVVKHIDKDTEKIITKRTVRNQIFEDEIDATEEIMEMDEYELEKVEPEIIKITTGENEIKIYYTKKEGKVLVHHYIYNEKENEYTTEKLVEDEEIVGKIGENYTSKKSENIPANYIVVDETPENSTGKIEMEQKEVNYYYKLKTPEIESDVGGEIISGGEKDENGNWVIKAGEEIKYKVNYNTQIQDYIGKVKIELKAELPKGTQIDINKCDLAGGTYNRETNSITWIREIEKINTYMQTGEDDKNNNPDVQITHTTELIAQLKIEKELTIVYKEDYVLEDASLNIIGKTILFYPGEGDKPLVEDEKDENGKVIIHHYIYDIEEKEYTKVKLVEDEEIIKKVGNKYTTTKSNNIPENYKCINEKPEGYEGKIEKETKEVNYYYELKIPEVENKTDSDIISGGEKDENGNWIIKAGEEIKYKISYETKIKNYIGRASIEVKAKLPEGTSIDLEKSKLSGGTYDKETNSITWTKEIENINTFAHANNNGTYVDGTYIDGIEKEITIVYAENYTLKDIGLKVTGNTKLYYPDGYIDKGENATIEGGKIIVHHYIYNEKENKHTTIKIAPDEEITKKIGENYTTTKSNKITENYECINETPENYEGKVTKETIEISYYYKLKQPIINSTEKGEIISGGEKDENGNLHVKAGEEIKYKVSYQTQIEDYIGRATIEVKAILEKGKEIDIDKCNLSGGTYDEETNSITWTKEIQNIDTFAHTENANPDTVGAPFEGIPVRNDTTVPDNNGTYTNGIYIDGTYIDGIEKEITIVYAEDYVLNGIGLKVEGNTKLYYPDEYPVGKDETFETDKTEGEGKVVIYHYIYDQQEDNYTSIKLVPNEQIKGKIGESYTTAPSKNIPENYECINKTPEGYTGKFQKETKTINYYYKLKTPKIESEVGGEIISGGQQDENGNWIIKAGEEIKYKVKYTTKIKDYKGKALIEIKAKLPEGTQIDINKCDLAGGTYEEKTNSITWTKEIENINTFAHTENTKPDTVGAPFGGIPETRDTTVPDNNGAYENGTYVNGTYIHSIEKEITIVYKEDYVLKDANLKVTGKTTLYYPDDYPIEKDDSFTQEETKGNGKVIIHHYIYDEKTNQYLEEKIAKDKEIVGKIGETYIAEQTEEIPENYICINNQPEKYTGTFTEENIEVKYYYKLKAPVVENAVDSSIISGGQQDEDGNWIIKAGEEIKYKIRYGSRIRDYKGKVLIEIKAKLPKGTQIDINKSDLAEGTYEETTNTITWTRQIENIDTFIETGEQDKNSNQDVVITHIQSLITQLYIEKQITIIYKEDYVLKDANLNVTGKTILYYPEGYPGKGDEGLVEEETQEKPEEKPEEKNGIIIVKYLDIDTNQEIGENYSHEITGLVGDEYETEEKQIPYYTLVKATENTKGQITEKAQTVIYYYKKQNFNIGIEKTINSIILNGENLKIRNNQTAKIELKKSEISKTELIVKYNIKVTNQGEIEGTAKILERIPEGYEIAYLPEYWKINRDGTLETEIDLKVGESRNIDIALIWENKESNLGAKTNIAEIGKTENQANYKDTNEKDNVSEATIVISIKTGEVVSSIIIMIIILSFGICTYIMIILTHKKEEKIKDIKFLNK